MILEERGHSLDQVIFFIPEHELLVAADASNEYFPIWPDSNGCLQKEALLKMIKMAKAGDIKLLVDGHHHLVMRGSNHIASFLQEFVDLQQGLTDVLIEILKKEEGLNVKEIYKRLQDYAHIPAVKHHLDMEYPASPLSLHQTIALYLVDLGYKTMGKWRNKKFFKPISK